MLKYIGIFLFCSGFAFIIERKQRAKGKETWESKHNINIPKWLPILLIILGILCTFVSNLFENSNEMYEYKPTDIQSTVTEQNTIADQSTVVDQNKQNTQSNIYELDGGKSGRTFYIGTDIPAGTYEIQAGRNTIYATVFGGEAENYEVIAHIFTDVNNVQDGDLTVGDTITLPNGGDISTSNDASIIFVAK